MSLKVPNITIYSLKDIGITADVEESGKTIGENALLKVKAYLPLVGDCIVLSDDTGLEINALNSEPGIHVRRWNGHRMTDEEIIEYTIEQLKGIKKEERGAQFRTSIAVAIPGGEIQIFNGVLKGTILEQPRKERREGFPFDPLFYCEEWGLTLGEVHDLSTHQRDATQIHTHRERALQNVSKYIIDIFTRETN